MKVISSAMLVVFALLTAFAQVGCTATATVDPSPDAAIARIHVIARPKPGVKEPIARVAVYDAAPSQASTAVGTYERVDYTNLADVMVWLDPKQRMTLPTPLQTTIVVDSLKESDHVHPGSVNQTITFRNKTARPVNLYSVSEGNEFTLPPIAPGASTTYVPKNEGLIEILADPAKPPIAQIYVAPTPWIAHARSNQTVTFNNVPPGEYDVVTWHPRLPGSTKTINLNAGQVTNATVSVGVNALSEAR
jgi:hypothetical protein